MLQFALAFLLGNGTVQLAPALDSPWLAVAAVGALVALLARWPRGPVLAFLLGMVWVLWPAHARLSERLPPSLEGADLTISGHVASIPEIEPYGARFRFDVATAGLPPHIELTWYERPMARAGEHWRLTVRLKRPHGFANPGGYDYEAQLFRENIGATGYVRDAGSHQRLADESPRYGVLRARAWLVERIRLALPAHPQQGVIRGLVVGDQQAIGSGQWRLFARTGISHLVAISGLHIGMIALLAAWLGGQFIRVPAAQRWRLAKPDLQALAGLSAAFGYSLLAGMSVPTQRTLIMLAVVFGARLSRRRLDIWQGFGLALLAVLLLDPFATLAVGTWLSFGAVALILLSLGARVRRPKLLGEFLRTQAVVTVGLVPLLLAAFGAVSLVSPFVNLAAIPLYTLVVVPLALLGTLLTSISLPLGAGLLQLSAGLLDRFEALLAWAAAWPLAAWHFPQPDFWAVLLMGAGVVLMVAPLLWPMRYTGLLLCLPAACWQGPRLKDGEFSVTLLDVGQGLAVVVQTREHTLLYDAGPAFRSGRDTGEIVVLPYLHANDVRRLDAVLASHGDEDHVGGLPSVLADMPVQRLLLGPSVNYSGPAERCVQGDEWRWDGVEFRILHPAAYSHGDSDNNTSCVLHIRGRDGSALLLGDIERSAERELLTSRRLAPAELVVAAHHGSRSSSTVEFIDAVQARYVLFSAGYRNRWGFPKEDVVARWRAVGAQPFVSAESGAIAAAFARDGLAAPRQYRKQHVRYWHTR